MRQHQAKGELIMQFKTQLDKLVALCKLYDDGDFHFAQEIAVKLRLLFHNTNNSRSLLRQLKLEHLHFVDTAFKYSSRNLATHIGLLKMKLDVPKVDFSYIPCGLEDRLTLVTFDNWWDGKKIIVDENKNAFTRKRLILEIANTDGGAHVDGLKEDYHKLSRQNSTGWWIKMQVNGKQMPFNDPVPPSVRQMAMEVIDTFSKVNIEVESKLRS